MAVALATVGGTAYAVSGGGSGEEYRTVAATTADVEQTLSSSGEVDAADRADLVFGTSGTVKIVTVRRGQKVRTGQVLARLDTTELDAVVTQARATLAKAVAQLSSDRSAQSQSVSTATAINQPKGSNGAPATAGTGSQGGAPGSGATAATLKQLKALQDDVVAAQTSASQAIAAAKNALGVQKEACADAYQSTASSSADSSSSTDTGSATSSGEDDTNTDQACSEALSAVQDAQTAVSSAQDTLQDALNALSAALTKALGQVGGSSGSTPSKPTTATTPAKTSQSSAARTATTAATSSTPASDDGAPGPGAVSVTAATLASDQAKIDQARADLTEAMQNRAQAVLRATRSGKVVSLDLARGDQVSAGSTVATVVGGKAVTVTGSVTDSRVGEVKVGQAATASVPGVSKTAAGRVTAIGLVGDSSTGTTRYSVTVTVEDPTISLPTGSSASLQVVLATAKDAVTVPISAVTRSTSGDTGTVQTWDGEKLSSVRVTLGAVGATRVQVTDGLTPGTQVVLADLGSPIKGASSTINTRGNGPAFNFRGRPPGGNGAQSPVDFSRGD